MQILSSLPNRTREFFARRRKLALGLSGVASVLLLAGVAQAAFKLRLTDNFGNTVTIQDQMVGDLNVAPGAITWSGALGNFTINVTTGLSKPAIGLPGDAQMDLNSVDVSGAAGTLKIELTDNNFHPIPVKLIDDVGGTTTGTVSFATYVNKNNAEFATVGDIGSYSDGPFGPGAFSDTNRPAGTPLAGIAQPYSVTMIANINHPSAGVTSFDNHIHIQTVPEASSLALLLPGLAPLGYIVNRRRRDRKA